MDISTHLDSLIKLGRQNKNVFQGQGKGFIWDPEKQWQKVRTSQK